MHFRSDVFTEPATEAEMAQLSRDDTGEKSTGLSSPSWTHCGFERKLTPGKRRPSPLLADGSRWSRWMERRR